MQQQVITFFLLNTALSWGVEAKNIVPAPGEKYQVFSANEAINACEKKYDLAKKMVNDVSHYSVPLKLKLTRNSKNYQRAVSMQFDKLIKAVNDKWRVRLNQTNPGQRADALSPTQYLINCNGQYENMREFSQWILSGEKEYSQYKMYYERYLKEAK